jgi:hypothetical protein
MAAGALLTASPLSARADAPSNTSNTPAATAGTAAATMAGAPGAARARARIGSVLLFPAGFAGDGMAAGERLRPLRGRRAFPVTGAATAAGGAHGCVPQKSQPRGCQRDRV